MQELEKEGYEKIDTTTSGYCLSSENDSLSIQGMLPYLSDKSLCDKIFIYQSLESTNKTAKEMAKSNAKHNDIIIAEHQSAGKGRFGRHFFSPAGCGIYISFILKSEFLNFETPTTITAFAANCVCDSIEAVSDAKPRIKWVNDVFIDEKKVCGILTESVLDSETGNFQWIILGIGVNFRTPEDGFAHDIESIAGAVFPSDSNLKVTRNQFVCQIINRITGYNKFLTDEEVFNTYRNRLMMLGEEITVVQGQKSYNAIAKDIDNTGRLIVEIDNGHLSALSSGEVRVRQRFD